MRFVVDRDQARFQKLNTFLLDVHYINEMLPLQECAGRKSGSNSDFAIRNRINSIIDLDFLQIRRLNFERESQIGEDDSWLEVENIFFVCLNCI